MNSIHRRLQKKGTQPEKYLLNTRTNLSDRKCSRRRAGTIIGMRIWWNCRRRRLLYAIFHMFIQ